MTIAKSRLMALGMENRQSEGICQITSKSSTCDFNSQTTTRDQAVFLQLSPVEVIMSSYNQSFLIFLLFFLLNLIQADKAPNNNLVPALYVFGDSYVDPGNNNYIHQTVAKGNVSPYGIDFVNQKATGRFSNGKVIADFLASYLGFDNYVPYLDPAFDVRENLAVGFASGGTGYDNRTSSLLNVIPMWRQLEYFSEYKAKLGGTIGEEEAGNWMKNAIFVVNCGVNDFVTIFYGPGRKTLPPGLTVEQYQQFLLEQLTKFVQGLIDLGARKFAISGVTMFGCWPSVITSNSRTITMCLDQRSLNPLIFPFSFPFSFSNPGSKHNIKEAVKTRNCIETLNSVANKYNLAVQEVLKTIQSSFANLDAKLAYFDTYAPLRDMVRDATKYGFQETNRGCCGTGLVQQELLCNWISFICSNRSAYVFWDTVHPTESASHIIATANFPTIDSLVMTTSDL